MIKQVAMLKRKSGITMEEFSRYWHDEHASLVLTMVPGIKRYIQNHAMKMPGGGEPPFDGVAELWFDDFKSWRESADFYSSDVGKAIRDDESKFLDRSKMVFFVAEERVIKP